MKTLSQEISKESESRIWTSNSPARVKVRPGFLSLPYESVVEGFVSTNFLRKQAEIEAFRREADVTIHKVSELLIVLEIQDSSSTRS